MLLGCGGGVGRCLWRSPMVRVRVPVGVVLRSAFMCSGVAPWRVFNARCNPDFPTGAPATAVVLELDGVVVPASVAAPGFVDGHAEVTLPGLSPGTPYSLRCRCELEDPEVDPDTLWSPPVAVKTLRRARHAAEDHPLEVLHRCCTSLAVRVRNPGATGPSAHAYCAWIVWDG